MKILIIDKKILFILSIFISFSIQSQVNFTWNGVTSSDWSVGSNWTPLGPPTNIDNVTIVAAPNIPTLISNTEVNNFTITSGSIDIVNFDLTINNNSTFTNGTVNGSGTLISNGNITVYGTTASGPTINPKVSVNSLTIRVQRTTFNNTVSIVKKIGGISIDSWRGGNTFNSTFYLENASDDPNGNNGDIYIGSNSGDPVDTFNSRATFNLTGAARIRIPQSGSAVFNGVVNMISAGFGSNHDRIQPSRLNGASCIFNDSVYFTVNSPTSDIHICFDAGTTCTFNGPVVCTRLAGANGNDFFLGNAGTVLINNNLTFNNLSTGSFNITPANGSSTLANGRTISIGTSGFNTGGIVIENFTQLGATNQNILMGTNAFLLIGSVGEPCIFNGNTINFTAGRVQIRESTFNGNSQTFNKTGATTDECGNNYFNGAVSITNSGTAEYRFSSVLGADIFNSTLSITNSNSSFISMSRTFNTSYPENITVNSTSTPTTGGIFFGANGGVSTLANTKTISVGGGGFTNGSLILYRFNASHTTPQVLNLSTGTILRLGNQANIVSGCNFGSDFTATAARIELTGNSFGGTTIFNQNGGPVVNRLWGGNTFIGPHTINVSGAASINCSQLFAADTYLSTVTLNTSSTGNIILSSSFDTNFPENIVITSSSTGSIGFGFNGGSSTLANTKSLSISGGYTGNFLYLYKFNQIGNTPHSFSLTGATSQIELGAATNINYGSIFNGNLTVNAPNFVIASSTFNNDCNFSKTGGVDNNSLGNNTFNGILNFQNNCSTAAVFIRASNIFGPETYNGDVTFSTSCNTGGFVLGRNFDALFNENIICNSTNGGYIYFSAANGLAGASILAANKTITCGTFNSNGLLCFRRFTQIGNTPQTISTTGTAAIEFGGVNTNTFTSTNWGGDVTVSSGGYTSIFNSTFQRNFISSARNYLVYANNVFNTTLGNTSLSKVAGTQNDDLGGNNTVNGDFSFTNSGSGRFRTGITAFGGDAYLGNVSISNSGTGNISFSYNNGTNTIGGDLNLISSANGIITFGEAATTNATNLAGVIRVVAGNFTNGTLNIRFLTQNLGVNNITGSGSAVALTLNSCILNGGLNIATSSTTALASSTFNGTVNTVNTGTTTVTLSTFNNDVTMSNSSTTSLRTSTYNGLNSISSAGFILGGTLAQGNTFNGISSFTKTGNSNDDVNGGNIFNNTTTITTNNAVGRWRLGATSGDDFNTTLNLVKNAAGVLDPAYSATSTYAGNINITSTTLITFGAAANGRVTFDGGLNQSINNLAGAFTHNITRLTTNKTTGEVTLNTPIALATDLNLISGVLNTDATNLLIMNAGSSVSSVNDAAYISGPIRKIGNTAFTFPVGKGGFYRPCSITAPGNVAHHFTSEFFNTSPDAIDMVDPANIEAPITNISDCEYWVIDRTNGASSVRVTLSYRTYGSNGCSGVTDPTQLTIARWDGAMWRNHASTGVGAPSGSITTNANVTSFSPFALGTFATTNPLPIELINFDAKPEGENVLVTWQTASEINNDFFTVEKSVDGVNFEYVAEIDGAGNSTSLLSYSTVDENPYNGQSFYRLKQTDFDGTFKYSNPVVVNFNNSNLISIYPNPVLNNYQRFTIDYANLNEMVNSIQLIDELGRIVYNQTVNNTNNQTIISTENLGTGVYFVKVITTNNQYISKVVIK